jgi:hypothetical protein
MSYYICITIHTNFYDYEKAFDEVWVELGRKVLENTIGEVPTNYRKNSVRTRYGKIEIRKNIVLVVLHLAVGQVHLYKRS